MTMAAYLQATKDGADGYECDVQLTKDNVPICFHDSTLNRTSNGVGRIGTKTLADLQKLDFGSWFGKSEKYSPQEWCSLLTLDSLLNYIESQTS
ncbi:MAG: glycerophosphodiester phosphodiesterase, partial [Actinobacteria bacterium]|nr:glycerophosphodiester phosphodiesterase [Actinomycetota bacterium]